MRDAALLLGAILLGVIWGGPLPALAAHSFTAHMTMHMGVVAICAPLIALGIAGGPLDPSPRHPLLFGPLIAAMLEFVVVWGWHLPVLHGAARSRTLLLVLEQGSFVAVGVLVWVACFGFGRDSRTGRSLLGTLGLLITSMHMTLLGALIAFAGRPLYRHAGHVGDAAAQVADQQIGGIVMLLIGGLAYLIGGLVLMGRVLLAEPDPPSGRQEVAR
jgi:putative membrane protein